MELFGPGQQLVLEHDVSFGGKVIQYTSSLEEATQPFEP